MSIMSIIGMILGLLTVVFAFVITRPLVELIIPQSEIDKIDAIGRWAKDELDRREEERKEGADG